MQARSQSRSDADETYELPDIPRSFHFEARERRLMERRHSPEQINDLIGLPLPPGPRGATRGQGHGRGGGQGRGGRGRGRRGPAPDVFNNE